MLTKSHQVNAFSQFVRDTKEVIFYKKVLGTYESILERLTGVVWASCGRCTCYLATCKCSMQLHLP